MKQHDTATPDQPVTRTADAPPTDAQWYSYCAMLARGEAWPGDEGQEGVARRHIRAALDKVNALETEKANLIESFRNLAAVAISYRKVLELAKGALINSADVLSVVRSAAAFLGVDVSEIDTWETKCREAHAAIMGLRGTDPERLPVQP